jgi:hypothetical protein
MNFCHQQAHEATRPKSAFVISSAPMLDTHCGCVQIHGNNQVLVIDHSCCQLIDRVGLLKDELDGDSQIKLLTIAPTARTFS